MSEERRAEPNPADGEFVLARRLDAPRWRVWRAWTEADELSRWFGPRGYEMTSARLDLRPGGMFHYGMRTQGASEMWGKWVFQEIQPPERLSFISSFSDAAGGVSRNPMAPTWPLEVFGTLELTEDGEGTLMTLRSHPVNATAEEVQLFGNSRAMMEGGWKGTLSQLVEHLAGG